MSPRPIPRQGFELTHRMDPQTYGRARELALRAMSSELDIPVWPEHSSVGNVNQGQVTFPIDATGKCYHSGRKLVLWQDALNHEELTIYSIGSGTIQTTTGSSRAYASALAAPARIATFRQDFLAARTHPTLIEATAHFDVTRTEDLASQEGGLFYPLYRGDEVVTSSRFVTGDTGDKVIQNVDELDPGTGAVWKRAMYTSETQESSVGWYPLTAADLWSTRIWLHTRRGRLRQFWTSSWNADLTVTADIADDATTVEIEDIDFGVTYSTPVDFGILTTDGTVYGFRVSSVTAGGAGKEILHLAETLPAIPVASIVGVSRLTLSRFKSDRIELVHRYGRAARIVVPVVEVQQ